MLHECMYSLILGLPFKTLKEDWGKMPNMQHKIKWIEPETDSSKVA